MLANLILVLVIVAQIAFLLFLLLMLLYFSSAIFVWPPSMPTDRRSRRAIIDFIKTRYPADARIKMIDLGSGYGHLIKTLSKAFPNAQITGVELLRLPYLYSKFIFCRNRNIHIVKDDLYNHSLAEYDVMVFFLRKDHKVDAKLRAEAKKGALVASNNFPLKTYPEREIREISDVIATRTIYFYELEK